MKNIDDLLEKIDAGLEEFGKEFDEKFSEEQLKQIINHLINYRFKEIISEKVKKIFTNLEEEFYDKIKGLLLSEKFIKILVTRLIRESEKTWDDY